MPLGNGVVKIKKFLTSFNLSGLETDGFFVIFALRLRAEPFLTAQRDMSEDKLVKGIRITIISWTIPMFGNRHTCPYGWLRVQGEIGKRYYDVSVKTKGDLDTDKSPQYVVIGRQRYKVRNFGTLYFPQLALERWDKEKINGRWMYTDKN